MNTPTPETDALEQSLTTWTIRDLDEAMKKCRKLERERDEAQRIIEQQFQQIKELFQEEAELKTERDQLRKVADELNNTVSAYDDQIVLGMKSSSRYLYEDLPHVIERNKTK